MSTPDEVLLNWLESNGASFPKVKFPAIHPTRHYRCAIALETIQTNEPICSVPFSLMVCVPNCLRLPLTDPLGLTLREMWLSGSIMGDSLLCACITREVLLEEAGEFASAAQPFWR